MSITQARTLIVKHHKYAWILTLVAVFVISGVYFRDTVTHAATFYFQQSSWSGGVSASTATSSSNQNSGWNTYDSASSTLTIGDNIILAPISSSFTDDGTLSTNGTAQGGGFGNGATSSTAVIETASGPSVGLSMGVTTAIEGGKSHSLALSADGTVVAWGGNLHGQLGDGTTIDRITPVQVSGFGTGSGVIAVSAGGNGYYVNISHSLALKSDGTVWAWGGNGGSFQLGDGTTIERTTPVQVCTAYSGGCTAYLTGVIAISAGGTHSMALKSDGTVWAWGTNTNGQLGDGTQTNRAVATQVCLTYTTSCTEFLTGVSSISASMNGSGSTSVNRSYSLALKADGTVVAWGYNANGQLGDGTVTTPRKTPVQVSGLGAGSGVTRIDAGGNNGYALALKSDGTVLQWGAYATQLTPVQVSGLGAGSGVTAIASGGVNGHNLVLKSDGTVVAWGYNTSGQLGDGTTTNRLTTPAQVSGLGTGSGVTTISVGGSSSMVQKSDGTVFSWGGNDSGQLGDFSILDRLVPVQTHGIADSGNLVLKVYNTPGTFTSAVINLGAPSIFNAVSWNTTNTIIDEQTVKIKVRSSLNDMSGATAWASCPYVTNGGDISIGGCMTNGHQYVQYQAELSTSNLSVTPTLDDITINYPQYSQSGALVSSAYNSESDANIMGGIIWTEDATLPSGAGATFYLRTSATSDFSGSSWSTGITSSTTGCSKVGTTVTCTTGAVDSALRDGLNDQWFQYKITLTSLGANTPTIDNVQILYVVNGPPTFDTTYSATGVITSQNATLGNADFGKVNISYRLGDIDTLSFTPSFKYSVNGGSTWSDIPANDLSASATSLKTYTSSATTTFSLVWNATSTLSASPVNIANAKVRVTAYDGDVANHTGIADSAGFTLDVTYPEITSGNFVVDSSVDGAGSAGTLGDNRAGIKLSATDYSTIQYRLCNNNAFPSTDTQGNSCAWSTPLSASPISLATSSTQWITTGYPSAETVYVQVRDTYGNVTSGTASAPAMPANFDYKDVSNTAIDVYREFLSWSLFSPTDSSTFTGNSSGRYKVYHAVAADGSPAPASSAYSVVTSLSDPTINYATHSITSATTSVHYYKVTAVNDQGSISDFTSILSDIPNGSGGAVPLPPVIAGTPVADNIRNTSARITFTTDSLATSTVEYGINNSYGTIANQTSFVENHSVYLNSLSPNTAYYFRAKATNAEGLDSDWAVGTTFTTAQGTVISGVTPMNVTDKTATIFWNTNASSTSKVRYSTSRSGNTLVNPVTVVGTSATTGTNNLFQHQVGVPSSGAFTAGNTYYYEVESTDADNNTTTDYNNGQFYSFTTTLDTTAPTISNISAAVVGPTSAVIVWTTDEPATSQVRWSGSTTNHSKRTTTDMTFAGIPSYSVYHVATLSSQTQNIGEGGGTNVLVAQTPYYYTVVSADAASNETESAEQTLTTTRTGEDVVVTISRSLPAGSSDGPTADTTSPVIANMKVSDITPFTAMVTFDTSEGAVGKLAYSKDASYGDHAADDFSWGTKHSIKLRGLTLGTQYHIKAAVVDKAGNTGYSEEQTFKTSFLSENVKELSKIENIEQFQKEIEETIESILPSLIPPFVSKPSITDITESGATISFRTNIKAFPLVGFVEDNTYDASKENPYASEVSDTTAKATNHTLALLNLKPNTKYHIQARAFSLPQVVGKSEDLTFTTQASKIQSSIVETKRDSFTVVWITDEPTTSIVEYKDLSSGITQRKADERKTTSHSMKIENLPSGTSFNVNVSGLNEGSNLIEGGSTLHVTTSRDVVPPTISNFKVSNAMVPGRTDRIQTIISWTTNEPADSVVFYEEGIGTAGAEEKELVNKSEVLDAYMLDHNIIISSLKPGAIYRVKVTSVDESGNLGVFGPRTIITPKQTESITDIIFKNFEDSFKFLRSN